MIKYTCRFLNELFKREHPKIYKFYLILSMSFPVHCYKCFILTSTGNGEELSKGWHFNVCEVCLLCDIYIYDNDDIVLQALQDPQSHSVTYTLSRHQAVVVEYKQDEDTDMFQVWVNSPGSKKTQL